MANQVNVSDSLVYVELLGNSIIVSDALIYIELNSSELRVSNSLVYLELVEPPEPFELFYGGFSFVPRTLTINTSLSQADITTLISEVNETLPILPDWSIDIEGFWTRQIANYIGSLSSQDGKSLSVHMTDRFSESIDVSNAQAFVTSFITDINIDNVMIYKMTFVGSGVLVTT